MRYTAIIPAYNAAHLITDALRSIFDQSIAPERVIVIDDGSTDDTVQVVKTFGAPVELVSQANTGPGGATTRGFLMAETPFIATLDADDIWLPGKIERQFAAVEADPGLAGVFGHLVNFTGDPASAGRDAPYAGWSRTTMLIRTAVAQGNGPIIDPVGGQGDMIDWLARLREGGNRLAMLADVVALRRFHESNMTNRASKDLAKAYLQVARDAMARRRAAKSGGNPGDKA